MGTNLESLSVSQCGHQIQAVCGHMNHVVGSHNHKKRNQPPVFFQEGADEVFRLVRDVLKTLLTELKLGSGHKS